MLKGKNAPSYLLAVFLLAGGTAIRPDTVQCLGPSGHSHLETIVGESCSKRLPVSDTSAPRLRDGCPRGSKDFRLGVDARRSDTRSAVALLGSVPIAPAANATLVICSWRASNPFAFLVAQEPPSSTIVLRC